MEAPPLDPPTGVVQVKINLCGALQAVNADADAQCGLRLTYVDHQMASGNF